MDYGFLLLIMKTAVNSVILHSASRHTIVCCAAQDAGMPHREYIDRKKESSHTIVCRAAQEASAPHREYIDRKKENIIFTPLYLGDTLPDQNQICYRVAR